MNNINYELYCNHNDTARLERLEEENKKLKETNSNLRNLLEDIKYVLFEKTTLLERFKELKELVEEI